MLGKKDEHNYANYLLKCDVLLKDDLIRNSWDARQKMIQ
jgi:hypothetical protein